MRQKACRRSTFMLKRDTMHPSSKNLLLVALFCALCTTLEWAQAAQNSQNQQSQQQQQQPVQDLTPPSDAEAERLATPAQPQPNQPGNATSVAVPPSTTKKGANDQYLFKKDVEEVMLYAT